jgi:cell division protein FtsL
VSARSSQVRSSRAGAARPDLKVVGRRGRRGLIQRADSRRFAPAVVAAVLLVGALIFAVLLEQVVLAQSAFEVARLTKQVDAAQERHQALLVKWAGLQSQGRIEHYARTKLGMVDPPPGDIQYIVANVPDDVGGPSSPARHRLVGAGLAAPQESP